MKNLAQAILKVMQEVKGIDKSMTVGSGNASYKGVSDKEVKQIIGASMAKHGLTILPIGVEPKTEVTRWEEEVFYSGKSSIRQKQSVFTEVKTKYLLLHESGESVELSGYGQGVDSQDKGAGKATTYALKYTLLYTFLTPTGTIDDADATHSDDVERPKGGKVSEPTTEQKAANMLKKPEPIAYDAEMTAIVKASIDNSFDQKALVKAWNDFPSWHSNKAFIDHITARKKELAKPQTKTTKKEVA